MASVVHGRSEPADQDACAREPIHIIGRIQSFGYLVAVSEPDYTVRFVSENLCDALGLAPGDVLRKPIDVIAGDHAASWRAQLAREDFEPVNPLRFSIGPLSRQMDCMAHRFGGLLILELEPFDGAYTLSPLNIAMHVRGPITRMEQQMSCSGLARTAAFEFRRTTGFERVIVYRFSEDWSGHVIAEAGGGPWPSYLGHHFPASDIPEQARRLFLINPLRAIADVASAPIVILDADAASPLDLSLSQLRAPAAIHVEYLRNMGVDATMTASIIVRGELWGMVTAHHTAPHRLDFTTRAVCGLLANELASRIAALDDKAVLEERLATRDRMEAYMSTVERSLEATPDGGASLDVLPLMDILDADGLYSHIDGVDHARGTVVEFGKLSAAIAVLRDRAIRGVASSDSLVEIDPDAQTFSDAASGALFLSLAESGNDYLVLLRKELLETILWAGDPQKSLVADAGGKLHPRASFASWSQSVRGRCRPWTGLELETARALREQLMQVRESQRRHEAEERVRYLAHFDVLTGLPNRSSIQEILEHDLARAVAGGTGLVILFVDLDRFKHYNDSLGHAAGDRILQVVSSRMQQSIRDGDSVGRIGGDEFIAVMPGIKTEEQALLAASRILTEIEKPFDYEGNEVHITASIGMSRYPLDGASSEVLLRRSDMAMYRAKEAGGNALEVFEDS